MKLMLREWGVLALLSGLMFSFFLTSLLSRERSGRIYEGKKHQYDQALIEINVTGAVISPGVYKFPPGMSVKDILGQARLTSRADKKKINFRRKIFTSEQIDVPEKEVIKKKKARIKQRTIVCESQPGES